MNLKCLKDESIIIELKTLVRTERETTAKILHYLREIETRKIYLEQGYPSLFEWVVGELGYSTGGAHRRIQSMRLLKTIPELEEKISSGEMSLSVAAQTQSYFRREDQLRRDQSREQLSLKMKQEIAKSLVGYSSRECERKLASIFPEAVPREKWKPISATKTVIQFVADSELIEKLEKLKGLMAHKNFDGRLDLLIEQMADIALRKLEPKLPKKIPTSEKSVGRRIPAAVKYAVWKRDQGRCTYQDPKTKKLCLSKHALQYDHLNPFA